MLARGRCLGVSSEQIYKSAVRPSVYKSMLTSCRRPGLLPPVVQMRPCGKSLLACRQEATDSRPEQSSRRQFSSEVPPGDHWNVLSFWVEAVKKSVGGRKRLSTKHDAQPWASAS